MAVTTSSCGPVDPQFIAVSKSCFGRLFCTTTYFVAWLTTSEDFRPVENLVYGVIRNTPLFVETEFLSLAQALDSLNRLTDTSTMVERSLFKRIP
jgi:hypothetical protein